MRELPLEPPEELDFTGYIANRDEWERDDSLEDEYDLED